ncbi:hypothetical protein PL263_16830 [Methylomonas sp. EFPC3]|uniref:hypothetical protein n=1 Tax=Methylomonas sp. EFPC3 TaxID=3021710 RepID=UPI00241598B0|nr:hypothetical protein [Methylomonas sp. EFPC3]WFP49752.1 hypothetical protein PL263_16830 [Methylomonas sp. EFPC3]
MEKNKALLLVLLLFCLPLAAALVPITARAVPDWSQAVFLNPPQQFATALSWSDTALSFAEQAERDASSAVRETVTDLQHWLDFGMQAAFFGWLGTPSLLEALPLQNLKAALPGTVWFLLGSLLAILSRKKRSIVS